MNYKLLKIFYTKSFTKTSSGEALDCLACPGPLPAFPLSFIPCSPATDTALVPLLTLLNPLISYLPPTSLSHRKHRFVCFSPTKLFHILFLILTCIQMLHKLNCHNIFYNKTISLLKRKDVDSAETRYHRLHGCVPHSTLSNITLAALNQCIFVWREGWAFR